MHCIRQDFSSSWQVAPQLVGDEPSRLSSLGSQRLSEEPLRSQGVTPALHADINDITILIDCPQEVVDLPVDGDKNLVAVTSVAEPAFTALEAFTEARSKLSAPAADRFVRYLYTPFGEEIFNIKETETEAMVQPDNVTNDLGRKPVAVAMGFALIHLISVPEGPLK